MTETYRALFCTARTGPGALNVQELNTRPLQSGELRIKVASAGLNFPDLLMTYGKYQYRPDPPFVPGMDCAGEIIEAAKDVTCFSIGDRVMAANKGGTIAEQIIVDSASAFSLPSTLSYEQGACWRTAAATAWHALVPQGRIQPAETVLVLGASGGVGMAAVKLAKYLNAVVIATASTEAKRRVVMDAGADHALDPVDPELAAHIKALTKGEGVDLVYDPVGGALSNTATRAIAYGGRYLVVGFASGEIPSFPANHTLIKAYNIIGIRAGETVRRDPLLAARQREALAMLASHGELLPHISHQFDLENARKAFETMERREAVGRIIIQM